jgi:hypothetical protein
MSLIPPAKVSAGDYPGRNGNRTDQEEQAMKHRPIAIANILIVAFILSVMMASAGQPATGVAADKQGSRTVGPVVTQDFQDVPTSDPFYAFVHNIYTAQIVSGYACGGPGEPCGPNNLPYYRPGSFVTRSQMAKFADLARKQPGIAVTSSLTDVVPIMASTSAAGLPSIKGISTGAGSTGMQGVAGAADGIGVLGQHSSGSGTQGGVVGTTNSGQSYANAIVGQVMPTSPGEDSAGVRGINSGTGDFGIGVWGSHAGAGWGVYGSSITGKGVYGAVSGNTSTAIGVYGEGGGAMSYAGFFLGNVHVTGTCCAASAGTYEIDHPLDPANKYLDQAAVQSSEMKGLYDGVAIMDKDGQATVELPAWFEAVNGEYRYQLTCVGGYAPVYIAEEVQANHFKIAGGKPGLKVSWQVTGVRRDPYAQQHPLQIEREKPMDERGLYLHPELYGQPKSLQIGRAGQSQSEGPSSQK